MQLYHDALLLPRRLGTMVYFTERFLSGVRHLAILYDRNQPREDGLILIVEKPWAGAFADHWPHLDNNSVLPRLFVEIPLSEGKSAWVLQSSIHNEALNSGRALTLGQRLIEGKTRWGTVTKVPGEFYFTDYYWEWLKLVVAWYPSTNTLHTMASELSISLWDLWSFGGIPIKRNDRLASSKNDFQVTIGSWISFWYHGSRSYDKPTTRKKKKASRSKSTQNPDGSKIQARSFLRLGVFRAASLMAAGVIYSLAVSVLANIYHGLGEGGSIYFGKYEARELIHNGARIQWHANLQNRNKHERMVDTHDCKRHISRKTLSELYLPTRLLESCKHVTQRFTDWWTTRHMTYFEDNRHHLVSSAIPPPSQPRLPKNRGSNLGGKEIRLVEVMAPNLEEEVNEHKDESDSSKSDRHWKRHLKKAKVSGDNPDGRGLSALEVPDVPPLSPLNDHLEGLIALDRDESLTGPHAVDSAFKEVGTSKTPVNKSAE
ncbi:putative mitochondrial protein [Cucumis melo var. makuwa]|uniref:Mitochondrial protein n=1 Tax=Cucumis melo var. makuwa TaxID=1194695 RepID=A0A5D3E2X8_CUCMM|nr:putative mitochondrial protein [Cucumis melo var. makuwa]TYK30242.1 putative mitochondrial protein [Cucumis melo var. makuwa]